MQGMLNVITFGEIFKIFIGAFVTGFAFGASCILFYYKGKQENKK